MPRKKKGGGGVWGDVKKWQNTLTGGLKFGMLKSTMSAGDLTLGAERFNIVTKGREIDRAIDNFHDNQLRACKELKTVANKQSVECYEKILFIARWAHPTISLAYRQNIADYVRHLLSANPVAYCHARLLVEAMIAKAAGTPGEKTFKAIANLILRIRKLTVMAYLKLQKTKSVIVTMRARMLIKKESTLRWMMETNPGRKDRFWTSWYYASRGLAPELERHLVWAKRRTLEAFEKQWGALEAPARLALPTEGAGRDPLASTGRIKDYSEPQSKTADSPDDGVGRPDPGQQDWRALLAKDEAWKKAQDNDVNERDPDFGLAPIHYAAKRGDMTIVRMLISHGASVNIRGPDGRTPLHYAAAYSNREICLELLSHWADVGAVDNYGCTAAVLAEQAQNRGTYTACTNWTGLLDNIGGGSTVQGGGASPEGSFLRRELDESELPGRHLDKEYRELGEGDQEGDEGLGEQEQEEEEEDVEYCQRPPSPIPPEVMAEMSVDLAIFARRFEHAPGATTATTLTPAAAAAAAAAAGGEPFDSHSSTLSNTHSTTSTTSGSGSGNVYRRPRGIALDPHYSTFLDMRVCEKFAGLCAAQGFVYERLKGLKRWFCLAKGLAEDMHREAREGAFGPHAGARSAFPFSPAACVAVGLQLVEALVEDRQEGMAVYYLDQCLDLPLVEGQEGEAGVGEEKGAGAGGEGGAGEGKTGAALVVSLLARKTEVLLCMLDLHLSLSRAQSGPAHPSLSIGSIGSIGSVAGPGRGGPEPSLLEPRLMSTGSVYVGSSGVITGFRSPQSPQRSLASAAGPGVTMGVSTTWSAPNTALAGTPQHHSTKTTANSPGADAGAGRRRQGPAGRRGGSGPGGKETAADLVRRLQMPGAPWTEGTDMHARLDSPSHSPSPHSFPTHTPPMLFLAQTARQAIEAAVARVEAAHATDLFEPYTVCPLLELLADVTEREGDPEAALEIYQRAEVVCGRTLGAASGGSVRIMVEVLRLTITCASSAGGYAVANQRAKELTKAADLLAAADPAAAAVYADKVVTLVSLAALLEAGQGSVKVCLWGQWVCCGGRGG